MREFVGRLAERQQAEGLSGEAFARKLGVAGSTWSRVRRHETAPGMHFIQRALRFYPELSYFLASDLQNEREIIARMQSAGVA